MKKYLISLLFIIMTTFGFTSCSIDNSNDFYGSLLPYVGWNWQPYQQNGNGQYVIGGYVDDNNTRAYKITSSDILNNSYDSFSLFGWTGDSVPLNNFNGVLNSNEYTWGYTENKKYFDNNQDSYSFLGIIPKGTYTLNTDSTVNVPLEDFVTTGYNVNEKQYNKEFIVAKATVNKANYSTGATLNFEHQNSIVRIKFETNTGNDLEILDFTPYTPEVPYQPAVQGTETYVKKNTKFIDELVAGHEVQVAIGFYGVSSPKLTKNNPNPLYVGSDNTSNGWLAKTWLLSIKDAVNSQFVYYKLNQVVNSTSKTETTDDWESAEGNKNIFMMKLADGVNATDFANGNDAFATALKAHQTDWKGGSDNSSFWSMFEQAYAQGWRVIRINVSDANANDVLVYLSSNIEASTQVCEVSGGSPEVPYKAATGHEGIIVLPATSNNQTGKDAALATFPATVTANIGLNGITYTVNTTEQEIVFDKVGIVNTEKYSPTNWYTFPVVHESNFGFTIKFSYKLNDVTRYDARIFVPATKCNWQPGKWYDYIIKVNSTKQGKTDPSEADETDPKINEEFPINLPSTMNSYEEGHSYEFEI